MKESSSRTLFNRIRRRYFLWLKIFFIVCLLNSVALFFNNSNDTYILVSMLVPFIHLGIVWCALMVYGLLYWARFYEDEDAMYIKNQYPAIWKKLHPFGDFSVNGFAGIPFMLGKYDDGKDDRLNRIKAFQKANLKLMAGTFFLVPVIWICNIVAIVLPKLIRGV